MAILVAISLITGVALVVGVAANVWIRLASFARIHADARELPRGVPAIVLGAAVRLGNKPSRALEERLEVALALFRQGIVSAILASGRADAHGYNEAEGMREWLRAHGVPDSAIRVDTEGVRTIATMQRARHLFGIDKAIVVSTDYHLPRAVFLARRAGIDAAGIGAHGSGLQRIQHYRLRELGACVVAVLESLWVGA